MELQMQAVGAREAADQFARRGDRAVDVRPLWLPMLSSEIFPAQIRRFETAGREGGGRPWKKLDPRTIAEKARAHESKQILQRTLALRTATTQLNAPHQVLRMLPDQLRVATDLPYARIVTKRRPIFRLTPAARESIAKRLIRFVDEGRA